MKIEFTWPDYLIPFVAQYEPEEYLVDLFLNSLLLENDEEIPRRMTRIVLDLTHSGELLWRWELPFQALSSHLNIDAKLSDASSEKRENVVGTYLAPQIQKLQSGSNLKPTEKAILRRFPIRFTAGSRPDQLVVRIYSGLHLIGRNDIKLLSFPDNNKVLFPVHGVWQVANNFDYTLAHRQYASQEFAIDLIRLSPNGSLRKGISDDPSDFVCFDQTVMAVEDGEVCAVESGMDDHGVKGDHLLGDTVKSWIDTYGYLAALKGNYIQIRHTENRYSFYAHLKQNSTAVKTGDFVRKGTEIARIGNSGLSRFSHLHLQMNDGPNPLGSRSLPVCFTHLLDIKNEPLRMISQNYAMVHCDCSNQPGKNSQ